MVMMTIAMNGDDDDHDDDDHDHDHDAFDATFERALESPFERNGTERRRRGIAHRTRRDWNTARDRWNPRVEREVKIDDECGISRATDERDDASRRSTPLDDACRSIVDARASGRPTVGVTDRPLE